MMQNCMQYNRSDTVYHREAKRLLNVGLKHLSRVSLLLRTLHIVLRFYQQVHCVTTMGKSFTPMFLGHQAV